MADKVSGQTRTPVRTDTPLPIGVSCPAVRSLTEKELQAAILELAALLRWRVAHFRPARTAKGWRTPVSADGEGWPDLVMVRGGRMVAAELKRDRGQLTAPQVAWLEAFAAAGVETAVWRPADYPDRVLAVLR